MPAVEIMNDVVLKSAERVLFEIRNESINSIIKDLLSQISLFVVTIYFGKKIGDQVKNENFIFF